MNISKYIDKKKELYRTLIDFIENDNSSDNFEDLINILQNQKILDNKSEFENFLHLLISISNNHHRFQGFFAKIERILLKYEKEIKQTFSNIELLNFFKSNKMLLLFLFKKEIILIDASIARHLLYIGNYHFFFPELKPLLPIEKVQEIEKELLKIDLNIFDHFEEKRQIGENDSCICSLIRNDSIHEFVKHINLTNTSLSSQIKPSIFETNSYLIETKPTLLEYAAFYGSIKIFNYIKERVNYEYTFNLFSCAVHSKSSEMIHILEEDQIIYEPSYMIEPIKCHHNDIAYYCKNMIDPSLLHDDENSIDAAFHYYNISFFPEEIDKNFIFYNYYHYKYYEIINFIIESKRDDFEKAIIRILYF